MPDIGYYTLPVIASFRGITGQVQDALNKSLKTAGTDAGKIMGQAAGAAFGADSSLDKAIQTAPASMAGLTQATDKQTEAVGRLQGAHKQLAATVGTVDDQARVIATQDRHTDAIRRTETQVKQAKTAHDQLAQSIKKVNDEQQRTTDIVTGGSGGGSFADNLKNDLGKALGGDTSGAAADLGNQLGKAIGTKIGTTLRDTVKDVTGSSVDEIADKVKSAGTAIGVDVGGAVTKAMSGDKTGALRDVGSQIGAKIGTTISGQVQSLTGLDLGGTPGALIQQFAPGAAGAAVDWATSGGIGDALGWLKGGGIGQTLGALRQPGGIRGALGGLGGVDPSSLLGGVNNLTGGGAQPVMDMQGGINDLATGLLGGTAAERFLPAIADAALPVAAGTFLGQKLGRGLQNLDRGRVEGGYDETGTATNPLERTVESIPVVGDFLGPSQDIRDANMRRRDAQIGSGESFYTSIFGSDRSGIGGGGGGGGAGGPVSTEDMQVDAGVATIQAGSVSLGGNITLPAGLTASGGGGGGSSRSSPIVGGASSHSTGEDSLYGGDSGGSYFAAGGPMGTDTALFWGTPGEWVIRKPTVDKYGPAKMAAINAGHFAGGGPIADGTTTGDHHGGPRGSANDPIYTMPSPGYTQAIGQQAPARSSDTGAGGLSSLLGGSGGGDAFNAAGGIQGIAGIGHQFLSDTLGLGTLFPDPTQGALGQAGMSMMQTILGMTMQPGGLVGALTSDAAGKRTFGALLGGGNDAGGGFGMIPQVAGMPHPDDMPSSPSDAAFGDVLSTRIGGGEATHVDNSTNLTVNGFSAQEVGNQVYRSLGQTGVPNNTPGMNTNMPAGG